MDIDEERNFAQRLASIEADAWEGLCREYSPVLLKYIQVGFDCGPEKAEEVVQRSFVRCVRSIGRFDPRKGRLLDWLKGICRNEARTLFAKDQRQVFLPELGNPVSDVLERIDEAALPEEVVAKKEVQLLVHEIVMTLHDRYGKVLILKYSEGKTIKQIATLMGQSEKAVESLLSRSRLAFKEAYRKKLKGMKDRGGDLLQ